MIFDNAEPSDELVRLSLEILLELGEPVRGECKAKELQKRDDC